MLILGLLLLGVAALTVVGAVFLLDGEEVSYFGVDVAPLTLYLIGAITVVLLVLGLKLTGFGAKRELRQRKEHRQLARLSEKLDKVEQQERAEEA